MKMTYFNFTLKMNHIFKISRNQAYKKEIFFVKIFDRDLCGISEAPLYPYYGQTKELAIDSLEKIRSYFSKFTPPTTYVNNLKIINQIKYLLYGHCGYQKEFNNIISCLDCALIDFICKKQKLSLTDFIKKEFDPDIVSKSPVSSYTIGLDNKEKMIKKIKEASDQKILKIKLGNSFEDNKNIINSIRKISNHPLRIDANCSWNKKLFFRMLDFLQNKNIELIEQPLPPICDNIKLVNDYSDILSKSNIPIILDESIINHNDIEMHQYLCSGINIKLSKCGGLSNALYMIKLAKKLNLKIMLGCMIESSLGINYALNLSNFVDYIDLDGNILTKNDPYLNKGNYKNFSGNISKIGNLPGIGISDL